MKKKLIEKVSYLWAMGTGEGPKYIATAGTIPIAGEEHLFIEIYQNDHKGMLEVPIARIVCTLSDWINYIPATKKWDRRKIQPTCGGPFWDPGGRYKTEIKKVAEQRIKDFTQNASEWNDWFYKIERLQDNIIFKRADKRKERKEQELRERNSLIEPVNEDFRDWYRNELFHNANFIYYKRKGRYATFTCSSCGKTYTYPTGYKDGFEAQFEHVVEVPRNGTASTCECCGAKGTYRTSGKINGVYGKSINCYIAQRFREKGAVIRYFSIEKLFCMGKPERFIETEIARTYFEPGKKVQKDYHLASSYGGDYWSYQNAGGLNNVSQEYAAVYPGTTENLKGTCLQYSALKEYMSNFEKVKLVNYFEKYMEYPFLEMLIKLQLIDTARRILEGYNPKGMFINCNEKRPEELLQIDRTKLHTLKKNKGDYLLLSILQMEKRNSLNLSEKEEEGLEILKVDIVQLEKIISYMTVKQFINRVEKYAGTTIDEDCCGNAVSRLQNTCQMYLDYLGMRERAGYDLHNSIYAYPRNLGAAHQIMVSETRKAELDKRLSETEEKYPEIRKRYKKLKRKYLYESSGYIIRPASSASEIVMEGRTLHHCVGGDHYLTKHEQGQSTILFLRFSDEPDIPYITVEISDEDEIIQWYGAYDKKPDKDKIDQWLNAYLVNLKCNKPEKENIRIIAKVAG